MRIVSLLPSATEILFALGAGDQVVGVTHECDYPPEAARLPHVTSSALSCVSDPAEIDRHVRESVHSGSSLYNLNSELLEQLKPDLILTQELCVVCAVSYEIVATAARRLTSDPRVVSLEPSSLQDVYANIATVGSLIGHSHSAQTLVAELHAREYRLAALPSTSTRTLVLEWTDPPMNGGHWTPGLVEVAGGTPVLCNPGANSQVISLEAIASEDPDVILIAPCGFSFSKSVEAALALADLPQFSKLRAYESNKTYVIDGNAYVNRPGPRLLDTAEIFARCVRGIASGDLPAYAPLAGRTDTSIP